MDSIVESTQHLMSLMMTELKHKVDNVLNNCDTSHEQEIEDIFDESKDVFNGLHTENLQKDQL